MNTTPTSWWQKLDIVSKIAIPLAIFCIGYFQKCSADQKAETEKITRKKDEQLATELKVLDIVWNDLNDSSSFKKTSDFVNIFLDSTSYRESSKVLRTALNARTNVVLNNAGTDSASAKVAANLLADEAVSEIVKNVDDINAGKKPPVQGTDSLSQNVHQLLTQIKTNQAVQYQLKRISEKSGSGIVYIQFVSQACREKVTSLKKQLEQNFIVPAIDYEPGKYSSEIRYYYDSDLALATKLKEEFESLDPGMSLPLKKIKLQGVMVASARQVELWLGADYCTQPLRAQLIRPN